MKNSAIALLLSIVLSMSSISAAPVFAAEMPAAEEGLNEQTEVPAEEGRNEQTEVPAEEGRNEQTEAPAEESLYEQTEASAEEGIDETEEASAEEAIEADEEAGIEEIGTEEAQSFDKDDALSQESGEQEAADSEAHDVDAEQEVGAAAPDASDKPDGADTISADQPEAIEEEITEETKKEAGQWEEPWNIKDGYENAQIIRVGEFKYVDIDLEKRTFEDWEYYVYAGPKYFKFIAEYDGYYTFSDGWCDYYDPKLVLYNSKLEKVKEDRSYWDAPCNLEFFSKKGEVWYLEALVNDWQNDDLEEDRYPLYLEMTAPGKTGRGDMFNLANNVKVTWQKVPGAKYYKVYRYGLTNTKETRRVPVIVTTGLVGWDKEPGLTNGHKYKYTIIASMTGKGDSSGDSPLYYTKIMYRLKTVVIRSAKNTVPGGVLVKYDKTTSGDSYVLQYSDKADMSGAKTRVVKGANTTSYMIGGLKKGKTYYISIRVRKTVDGINYYTTFGVPTKVTITK